MAGAVKWVRKEGLRRKKRRRLGGPERGRRKTEEKEGARGEWDCNRGLQEGSSTCMFSITCLFISFLRGSIIFL